MNRLSSRVQERRGGGGGEVGKAQKKGGEEGVKPVDRDLKPCRNRRRHLNLYGNGLLPQIFASGIREPISVKN